MTKLHELWNGNNRFLGCGITGPAKDLAANICVYITTVGATLAVSIWVTPTVWNITPVLPIALYIMVFFLIMFLILTSFTDPGIIPKKPFLSEGIERHQKYLFPPEEMGDTNNHHSRNYC